MVTKSEEENIMDKAVGSKIADYLIKPVNPNQVLLSIKKNVHSQQLVTEQTTADYRSEFGRISASLQMAETFQDWCSLYRKITSWEIELESSTDQSIKEILLYQKTEANQAFCKFVRQNYYNWINRRSDDTPVMSHTLMRSKIFPRCRRHAKATLLLIDISATTNGGRFRRCCADTTMWRLTISTAPSCRRRPNTPATPYSRD